LIAVTLIAEKGPSAKIAGLLFKSIKDSCIFCFPAGLKFRIGVFHPNFASLKFLDSCVGHQEWLFGFRDNGWPCCQFKDD
jgi:hypothetical protein